MRILLFLLSLFAFIVGLVILHIAKSAIHEIEAFSLCLIAAVLFTGACVVDAIHSARNEIIEQLKASDGSLTTELHTVKKYLQSAANALNQAEIK
jgi:hypothetical protein